jgi:hypothetical protein
MYGLAVIREVIARTKPFRFIHAAAVRRGFGGIIAPGRMRPMMIGKGMQNHNTL